jgi:tetratricopeptide (TPR) repeat protein
LLFQTPQLHGQKTEQIVSDQRLKRLENDYERLSRELLGNDFIEVGQAKGTPPNQYTIEYNIKGVKFDQSTGQTSFVTHHEVQIILLNEYPSSPPYCKIKTEIFHPNMNESEIWIGDESACFASTTILDVVKHIACMISYQSYDLNSPLNEKAAGWAKKNEASLPLDSTDFFAEVVSEEEDQPQLEPEVEAKEFCAYCLEPDPNNKCGSGHPACDDCLSTCEYCDNTTCLACIDNACGECQSKIDAHCSKIDAAIERAHIGESVSLAKKALKEFPDVQRLLDRLDGAEQTKKLIAYIETCRKTRCFYGIVTACKELKSLGLENEALAKIEKAASDKLKAADAAVAHGKKELEANHKPELACKYFSKALQIVPDHPSAYKLVEEAKKRTDKARKYVGSAQERLEKGHYDRALEYAKKAVSLDATVGPQTEGLIDTANRFLTSGRRKKKTRILALVATGCILILSSVYFFYVWDDGRLKTEYHAFLDELENEPTMEEKIDALSGFVMSHKTSRYTRDAEKRIADLYALIQERQFEIAKRNANIMLKNKDYKKAETIYQQLLSEHPDATYTGEVNKDISRVRSLADDKDYEAVRWLSKGNAKTRVSAYQLYLTNHPEGKHIEEVKKLIADCSEDYYKHFKEEIALLKSNEDWNKCIQICNEFDENLDESQWGDEVEALRSECLKRQGGERDLAALTVEADAKGEDYTAARQVYLRYLEDNPDSSVKSSIISRADALDEKIRDGEAWEKILPYVTSEENDLGDRIGRVKGFLEQNPPEELLEEATQQLKELEEKRDTISWKETIKSCRDPKRSTESKTRLLEDFVRRNVSGKYLSDAKARLSELKTEQASGVWKEIERYCNNQATGISGRINKLTLYINQNTTGEFVQKARFLLGKLKRLSREEEGICQRIKGTGNAYVYNNGTITDRRTGLMWCAFDSYLDMQKCLRYESATRYVKRVRYGGYSDWRLPSEEELRSIYKKKPFFPTASEGKWCWSSNQGGGQMVSIVTTERETEWRMTRIEAGIGCGSIRAVRGP